MGSAEGRIDHSWMTLIAGEQGGFANRRGCLQPMLFACEWILTGIGGRGHTWVMVILGMAVGRSLYLGILHDRMVTYWLSSVVHIVRGVSRR
jgi:hypothetical protein